MYTQTSMSKTVLKIYGELVLLIICVKWTSSYQVFPHSLRAMNGRSIYHSAEKHLMGGTYVHFIK